MSNPSTVSSIFPLPAASPAQCLEVFSGFGPDELTLIAGSNESLAEPTDPVGHLLQFGEDRFLAASIQRNPSLRNSFEARRYRAGVCIAATIVRQELAVRTENGIEVPELRVDPGRRYLAFPEVIEYATLQDFQAGLSGARTDHLYLGQAVRNGYFGEATVNDAYALAEVWRAKEMDLVLPDASDRDHAQAFDEVGRGILHGFRLYRILKQEARVAPWSDRVYDPARHMPIGDQSASIELVDRAVEATDERRNYRRWEATFSAHDPQRPEGADEANLRIVGENDAPLGATLLTVGTVLTGYVQPSADDPGRLARVAFPASERQFELRDDDRVIVRDGKGYTYLRSREVTSLYARMKDVELIALVRDGHATMLQGRNDWPEPIDWPLADVLGALLQ